MISDLAHRIQSLCGEELEAFRRGLNVLEWQDFGPGSVEGAVTSMAPKPSCLNSQASVDVVGFAQPSIVTTVLMVSVTMRLHHGSLADRAYAAEADAWAHAIARDRWIPTASTDGQESTGVRVFHYVLTGSVYSAGTAVAVLA